MGISRHAMQQNARHRQFDREKSVGVWADPEVIRARVQAEKLECPICLKPVHPDNWNKHMTLEHQDSPVALHDSMPGRLSLSVIRMDGGTQPRAQIDLAVVADYVEQMTSGVVFPAVTVFYDGANYWLADGFHRVTAAKQTDETEILADVKQGTQRDAKLFSFSANAAHGLRRTNSDKRRAVEAMLNDNEWSQWSNAEIARRCNVSHTMVNNIRSELETVSSSDRTYTQQRGDKSYTFTMQTSNIGSKPALPATAPTALQAAVDSGVIGVREAVKSNEVLVKLPPEYHDTIATLTHGDMDKIGILQRLYKSMDSPETNGTFEEIMRTGGFQCGKDMDKWCNFEVDSVEVIHKALQSVADHHKREEVIARSQERSERIAQSAALTGTYPLIYADPPWQYESQITPKLRAIENHYDTQSLEWICNLEIDGRKVTEIAAPDAMLFMWTTAPKLEEAFQVINAWGFTYRTCMVWDKELIGQGHYVRVQHELLLIAKRGNPPVPFENVRPSSVYRERRGEHSVKPHAFYDLLDRMYPDYQKLELFSRNERDGWTGWGNDYATTT